MFVLNIPLIRVVILKIKPTDCAESWWAGVPLDLLRRVYQYVLSDTETVVDAKELCYLTTKHT